MKKKGRSNNKNIQVTQRNIIRTPLNKASNPIALIDNKGFLLDVNIAFCQFIDLPRHSLIGVALSKFLDLESNQSFLKNIGTDQQANTNKVLFSLPNCKRCERQYSLTPYTFANCHLFMLQSVGQSQIKLELEVQRQRKRVELFSDITLKIRKSLQLDEILQTTVTEVQRLLQADRVLVYQIYSNGTGKAISESVSDDYPAILNIQFPEEVFPACSQQLYLEGRVRAIFDVQNPEENLPECLIDFIDQFDIKSKLIVPILYNSNTQNNETVSKQNHLWGLVIAHQCSSPREWSKFELELMQQLANHISIALAQARILEQQEKMVELRTAELTELNHNLTQEINDRMQAEAALRESEEQLRLITNALPVLIAYIDKNQRYCFNNKPYEEWLGKSIDSIHGCHLKKIWGEKVYTRILPYINKALSGQTVSFENEISLASGKMISVDVIYIPHLATRNKVNGFFALTADISDRKAIERMKDEFISVVSHELRTPLTSLHSALKILASGQLPFHAEEGQQMLDIANDSTDRLVRLVNNVLDLQRIESAKVIIDGRSCNAADLMTQATESMQAMAQQHGIRIISTPKDILVWADADYILQALTNLLSNAIKFSSPGSNVKLSVDLVVDRQEKYILKSRYQKSETIKEQSLTYMEDENLADSTVIKADKINSSKVLFRVKDQGQGIPNDHLNRIFERFQQVDSTDSRKKGGTGLGLTICKKIIEKHNGTIWVESKLGSGSIFSFTLPAVKL